MKDTIYREDAIDAILDLNVEHRVSWKDAVIDTLDELPSAQQWIPCSERLPEESGCYLVTVLDGLNKRTTFVKYQKRQKAWELSGRRAYWKVRAWMPLPEPPKGE